MAEAVRFKVVFDGPAVKDGAMDVRELAPALLALGGLCERANGLLNQDRVRASVRVEARLEAGSFDVSLQFAQDLAGQVKELFTLGNIHDANEVLKFLGINGLAGLGLVKFLKWLRGRSTKDLPRDDHGNVTITINNSALVVAPEVLLLANDPQTREEVDRAVAPVRREGIDAVRFEGPGPTPEVVTKGDADAFRMPRDLVLELQRTPRAQENIYTLELVTPQFDPKLKWRLQSEGFRITAIMKDEGFLKRVHARDTQFTDGDFMTVRVRTVQTINAAGKPSTENEILEVIDHKRAPLQLPLSAPTPDDEES